MSWIDIEAHSYDIEIEENESSEGEIRSEIRLWCMDRQSKPCLLRVRDFPIFCKAELPRLKDYNGDPISWDDQRCSEIVNDINKKLDKKELSPIREWSFIEQNRLYYHSSKKKYPFLLLVFNTVKHMYEASTACKSIYTRRYGKINIPFYEMDSPQYNKMYSLQNMSMTDRFTCKAQEIPPEHPDRISKPGSKNRPFSEYQIKWKTMKPSKDVWFSYPVLCSFDIESYSHNHRTFPEKHDDEDIIFSISLTFSRYMSIEERTDIIIIIGDTHPPEKIIPSEEGKLIIYNVEDEKSLLEKFFELIIEYDPDVFTGYNIYGFDFDYMDARILDTGDLWPNMSRLDEESGGLFKIKNLSWSSSGRGANKMFIPQCSGRVSFDMYKYVEMDYKMSVYTLEAVANKFLGEGKEDLKYHEMFKIHHEVTQIMRCDKIGEPVDQERREKCIQDNSMIVKYNVQDSLLVTKLFEKLGVWTSVIELSSIVRVIPMHFCTRGQQIRCVAQIYHAASHKDIVMTIRQVDPIFFEGGLVENPIVGFWKDILCFDFTSLYPSICIANNICFTTLVKDIKKYLKKHSEDTIHIFNIKQEEPVGWKPPKQDRFDYTNYIEDEEKSEEKPEKVMREYTFGFVKREVKKGLVPGIEENLLSTRKNVKKDLKKSQYNVKTIGKKLFDRIREEKDIRVMDIDDEICIEFIKKSCPESTPETFLKDILENLKNTFSSENQVMVIFHDSRQKGLKICANSLYGFYGSQATNRYSLIEGSIVITFTGRSLIRDAGSFFNKYYGAEVVYGDSIPGFESVILKNQEGTIMIDRIEDIIGNDDLWFPYEGFKSDKKGLSEKQQAYGSGYKSWSKGTWHRVKRFIRHKTAKKIYRITTKKGSVCVTEDHSLLDHEWNQIKPEKCNVQHTRLAHSYPNTEDVFGAGEYNFQFEENTSSATLNFVEDSNILSRSVWNSLKNGYNYRLDVVRKRVVLVIFIGEDDKDWDVIQDITLVYTKYDDYVYDIETENGHFLAGIGSINVKNTDSTMVHVPSLKGDTKKIWSLADKMEKHINGKLHEYDKDGNIVKEGPPSIFLPPLYLEAEKMMRVIFMKKKHYAYLEYDRDGNIIMEDGSDRPNLECKGILIARRDNCLWSRYIYEDIIRSVFDGAGPTEIFKKIVDVIVEVIDVEFDTIVEKFSIVKKMGSNYKSKTAPMLVFSEEMKSVKRPIQPGERVKYVVVRDHKKRSKVCECMRTVDFFNECWDAGKIKYGDIPEEGYVPEEGLYPPEELDPVYYIEKVLMNPIDNLFGCIFNRMIEPYKQVGFTPVKNKRLKKVTSDTPVKMIVQIIKDNKNVIEEKGIKCMSKSIKDLVKWFDKIQ